MNLVLKYFKDFISLIYPRVCMACNNTLVGNEDVLCTTCRFSLPETEFHLSPGNPIEQIFWGRIPVVHATSLLFFDKGSKYRHLLHQLKYKGAIEIGIFLGQLLGARLADSRFNDIDIIVPVPLHFKKLKSRGYNQSDKIALGVAKKMNKPVDNNSLIRTLHKSSQTYKGRYERWENSEGIFKLVSPENLNNKHVLLIDDIITTGATLEAAGSEILNFSSARLSIATIAYTS